MSLVGTGEGIEGFTEELIGYPDMRTPWLLRELRS